MHDELRMKEAKSAENLEEDILDVFFSQDYASVSYYARELMWKVLYRYENGLVSVEHIIETHDIRVLYLLQELYLS